MGVAIAERFKEIKNRETLGYEAPGNVVSSLGESKIKQGAL